ncbi:MAG: HNH endonuclease [Clostridiaceae bacterium]|nr:HNH endonuclease [Clostridiaceae bacterium]
MSVITRGGWRSKEGVDLTEGEQYIYKKEVDWSLLHEGFTIPVSFQVRFHQIIGQELSRGSSKDITVMVGNRPYTALLKNQNFDQSRYPTHKDLLQIRYKKTSPLADILRTIFNSSYEYLKAQRAELEQNNHLIRIPEDSREYLVLYTSDSADLFIADCLTVWDLQKECQVISSYSEEALEAEINYRSTDPSAGLALRERIVKVRRFDKAIADNLKLLYDNRCQICGNNFGARYDTSIAEAHHIDSFIKSLNNDSDNIMILCPNHHRIIHKTMPIFERAKHSLVFHNGYQEQLRLNYHL